MYSSKRSHTVWGNSRKPQQLGIATVGYTYLQGKATINRRGREMERDFSFHVNNVCGTEGNVNTRGNPIQFLTLNIIHAWCIVGPVLGHGNWIEDFQTYIYHTFSGPKKRRRQKKKKLTTTQSDDLRNIFFPSFKDNDRKGNIVIENEVCYWRKSFLLEQWNECK